jgi:hypothetical protein
MPGPGFNAEVLQGTAITKVDPASSAEEGDWLFADITFNDVLTLGSVFSCHDLLSPKKKKDSSCKYSN